jgi:[ribosomal protein S5]-alanine N-acetyltransferase
MHYEGRMRETTLIRDGWRDSDVYSVLVHESPTFRFQLEREHS